MFLFNFWRLCAEEKRDSPALTHRQGVYQLASPKACMQISPSGLNGMTSFHINQIKSSITWYKWQQTLALWLWEIISFNLMGRPLPVTQPIILFITKWNCQPDFLSFLFFFFLITEHYFSWAIWSHCGTPVNFRALELLSGPPLVRVHSFVLFSAVCWLLALRGAGELGHCQRLWKIIQWWSQHTHSLNTTDTSGKHQPDLHYVDL